MKNLQHVNNWNLVDTSAHIILGSYLLDQNREIFIQLAKSNVIWERRIAIISTLSFIKNHDYEWTLKIAYLLINDTSDLIHKAVGWMLREVGKRNQEKLMNFLDLYAKQMPRTMLRYAIEKFPKDMRAIYLAKD